MAGKSTARVISEQPQVTHSVLEVRELSVRFGGLQALNGVHLAADGRHITSVIGPNGAGKTTAVNCISGMFRPDSGSVRFNGAELLGLPRHRIARMGLTRTFQNLQVFGHMNVLENVMVGMHAASGSEFMVSLFRFPRLRKEERRIRERSEEMLDFFELTSQAYKPAGQLSYGDRKKVELARALVSRPRMVLLDEPVAGLNMAETETIGRLIGEIRRQGIGVVLVEHDMALVMRISDKVVVLCEGRVLAEGTPHEIQNNSEVIRIYLGGGEEFGLSA